MAKTWLSVTVELLGGRGQDLWPWPGRVFAIGPSHTFQDLSETVNTAFARWDQSHVSMFTFADGRIVTDDLMAEQLTYSPFGVISEALDIETTKVAKIVSAGEGDPTGVRLG